MSSPLPSKSDVASEGMDVDDELVERTLGSDAENEPEDKVAKEETDGSTTDPKSEDKESSDDDAHNDDDSEGEEVLSVPVEGQSGNRKATAEELTKAKEDEAAARAKAKAEAEKATRAKVKEEARAKVKKEKERGKEKEKEKATALAQSATKRKDRKEKEGSKGSDAVANAERSKVVVEKGNKPVPEEVAKPEKKKPVVEKEKVDTRRDGKEKRVIVIPQVVTKLEKKKEDKSKEKEPVLVLPSKKHTIVEVEIPVSGKETRAKNWKVVVESSSKEDEDIPPDWVEGMVFHTPECVKCAERHKGPQGSTRQTVMDWPCHGNLKNQCTACIFRHSGCSLKGIRCKTRGQTTELHSTTQNLRSVIPPIMRSEAGTVCNLHSQMTKELNNLELQLMMMKNEFDAKIMALRQGINFLAMAAEASVDSGVEELE